jgi:hypothetical protein
METKARTVLIGLTFIVAVGFFALRPVPICNENDCVSLRGEVADIYESGTRDISFKLKGLDKTFYINRGIENGLELEKLKSDLMHKEIEIKYPKYWTPLDPMNSVRHISKLEAGGQTIFTELKN